MRTTIRSSKNVEQQRPLRGSTSTLTETTTSPQPVSPVEFHQTIGNQAVQRILGESSALKHGADVEDDTAPDFEQQLSRARAEGQPISPAVQRQMEGAMGASFSGVRVHNGPRSAELSRKTNARALTYGQNIYFNEGELSPGSTEGRRLLAHELTHTVQQRRGLAGSIQRAEKIKKEEVRIFNPESQISAQEVATLAVATVNVGGTYDMVISSGSTDAGFEKVVENIALFTIGAFTEADFRSVLALDFSQVDWKKAGVTDAATIKKFGSGLHAFEVIRWDGGKKLQLRMNYLKEITEINKSDYDAKIKQGKTNFATAGFTFEAPSSAQKKLGYKDWTSGDKDIVYMAVSRLPDAMLNDAGVKGIKFYRVTNAGKNTAQYDQFNHAVEVGDDTYEVTDGAKVTPLTTPSDLYQQSSVISGDATTGFTSSTEYVIVHEIAHAMDWGPIRAELGLMSSATALMNTWGQEVTRLDAEIKKTKDPTKLSVLQAQHANAQTQWNSAAQSLVSTLNTLGAKTTLSGETFALSGTTIAQTNPAAKTDFEKAVDAKVSSTVYAAKDMGEAFAEGLALYVVNPDLLKDYRPDLHAYFLKLLPP